MGSLETKTKNFSQALKRFHEAIIYYQYGLEGKVNLIGPIDTEDLMLSLRDSMIQRFEFTIELFWKFLKCYLEEKENLIPNPSTPRSVIRTAAKSAILSEDETELILKMFESRNLTSHVYQDRVAQDLAEKLPAFYALMMPIFERLTKVS